MSFNKDDFRVLINRVLRRAHQTYPKLYSPEAVELLMGTAAVEMDFGHHLYQLKDGPGLGFFSMEPDTEQWLWTYMGKKAGLIDAIVSTSGVVVPDPWHLETNLAYQVLMARVRYLPYKAPIPQKDDVKMLSIYWDLAYNKNPHNGFPEDFVKKYNRYCN